MPPAVQEENNKKAGQYFGVSRASQKWLSANWGVNAGSVTAAAATAAAAALQPDLLSRLSSACMVTLWARVLLCCATAAHRAGAGKAALAQRRVQVWGRELWGVQ
eukprot:1140123-Pelagomonas_calceolata.AAC.1